MAKTTNSSIRMLKARHGDAFILDLWKGENHGCIVVDGGPSICGNAVVKELLWLEHIDLMILTHFDDDHIGGILKYVQFACEDSTSWKVDELWVNNSKDYPISINSKLSYSQALRLSDALEKIAEVNNNLLWKPYISEGVIKEYPYAKITVLSPPLVYQNAVIKKLEENRIPLCYGEEEKKDTFSVPLDSLVSYNLPEPNLDKPSDLANAASLAFLIESDDFSILMLGDSFPNNVERYLRSLGYSEENKLVVDYVKVSHHGSVHNSSGSLYDIIACDNYLISTDSGRGYHHPDREAIATIVCHKLRNFDRKVHIFLNYPDNKYLNGNNIFVNQGEEEKFNFEVHYNTENLPL